MPQARSLMFGAALLALAVPGHPLAPLPGLPLGVAGIVVALLIGGWWIALPGRPPRAGLLLAALLVLAALKLGIGTIAPRYGLAGAYRSEATGATTPSLAHDPDATVAASTLDLRSDAFPVHFFNDIRHFNYYTANDPKRDLLPFSAVWTGQLVVPTAGRYTVTVESNGPATIAIGTGLRAGVERSGRVSDASATADLPAGLVPITVSYVRPPEAMPWLVVRAGPEGGTADVLAAPRLVLDGVAPEAVARDGWLLPLAIVVDLAILLTLMVAFMTHLLAVVRPRLDPAWMATAPADRVLLALYALVAAGRELVLHLPLHDRAVMLSGGNDWLAYEGFARDVIFSGPLLTEGRALGQGVPYYYQPLYIYWVALTHLVLGESLFAPLFMNTVLGIAAGVLIFMLTRELFGRGAAFVALLLFEAYRQTVFAPTAGLLLSENLVIPLVPLILLLLVRASRSGSPLTIAAAGFVLGLGGLTRTTPLALLPPAVLILGYALRRAGLGWSGIAGRLALLVLACFLTISPATIRNAVVSGRPVLITSSAGANLWETHRPTAKVDLSRVDRDPLYERLGLDRQTREVVEFVRQDPAGYVATLVPMFLYAVGVIGAVVGTWDVHPGLVGIWIVYLLTTLLSRRARSLPTWFLHSFIWSHLAQMTVFFSHQYGFRLILPMYVGLMPIAGLGIVGAFGCLRTALVRLTRHRVRPAERPQSVEAPVAAQSPSRLPTPAFAMAHAQGVGVAFGSPSPTDRAHGAPTAAAVAANRKPSPVSSERVRRRDWVWAGVAGLAIVVLAGVGVTGWRSPEAAREAFYGLNGDAALATRQVAQPDLLRLADAAYFVGDDSRSTDVAYLRGLAYPTLRWFDGARGLVLPPPGQQAVYVLPDRAAADVAKRCLGADGDLGATVDATSGLGLDLRVAAEASGDCGEPRIAVGAPFAETGTVTGLDAPASIEPGKTMDVLISWQALARPANRARPIVRLVDSKGRRWGQAETAVYPSSAWHPGERAIGLARLEIDQTLPPGDYRLDAGFSLGQGQDRLAEGGVWGVAGQPQARGGPVRVVSRSTPLTARSLGLKTPLDASFDGVRLLGATLDRDSARAGERVRLTLYWQNTGGRLDNREVIIAAQDASGSALKEWRGVPVDGTYPTNAWKPSEIVRDTWDLVLPPSLPGGPIDFTAGLAAAGRAPQPVRVGALTVQSTDIRAALPDGVPVTTIAFGDGAEVAGIDLKSPRLHPGDQIDLTLFWRATGPIADDATVTVALLDGNGRVILQQDSEPAGGNRPMTGWMPGEIVEDAWKLRLPRDVQRGTFRVVVSLVSIASGLPVPTTAGPFQVSLPPEVTVE